MENNELNRYKELLGEAVQIPKSKPIEKEPEPTITEPLDTTTTLTHAITKLDNNIVEEVSRLTDTFYSTNRGTITDFKIILKILSDPLKQHKKIEKRIAIMMLLEYLKEIKNSFNASSAGFIFESFVAGLLKGKAPSSGGKNLPYDVITAKNVKISLKFLQKDSSSVVGTSYGDWTDGPKPDYMVLANKAGDNISFYFLKASEFEKLAFKKDKFLKEAIDRINEIAIKPSDVEKQLKDLSNRDAHFFLSQADFISAAGQEVAILNTSPDYINKTMDSLGDGIQTSLSVVYNKIKLLNDSVKVMTTEFKRGGYTKGNGPGELAIKYAKELENKDIPELIDLVKKPK